MKKQLYFYLIILFSTASWAQIEPTIIEGFAQGTTYNITYLDAQNRNLQPEIDRILADFDQSVSTYQTESIISRINRNEKNVVVDRYFKACFKKAKEVWENTNGAFDPTVYPLVNAWGFGPGKKQYLDKKEVDSILQFVNFDLIQLKGNTVVKKDPRVCLDFNAFAQGYSVDVVAEFLNSKGIKSYIVEIGGEVYAKGKNSDGNFWTIGIEKPIDNKVTKNPIKSIARIDKLAVATSGNNRRYVIEDGVKYAHHLDPKTGYPTKNNLLSASIFARQCISADANATGVLVMGLEKAKVFLKKHPELEAYLVYSDENGIDQVYKTPGIEKFVSEIKE
jgi:thiamine biosynthesis lipoprotein